MPLTPGLIGLAEQEESVQIVAFVEVMAEAEGHLPQDQSLVQLHRLIELALEQVVQDEL